MLESDEEEVFYQHPTEDIRCNQLGALYYDEDRYVAYDMKSGSIVREHAKKSGLKPRIVGSKHRVIWECYHQTRLESGIHFLYLNANPLDTTKENLVPVNKLDAATKQLAAKTKARFIKDSVEHLVKLEVKYEKRGLDKTTLHELLQIPNWLEGARKRWTGPVPKAYAKKL